jgi:putative ABC transport system ATP-binding protein
MGKNATRVRSSDNASASATAPLVRAEELTKGYRRGTEEIQALKGIDIDIQPGEFVCLLGRSGAGKTTTLNLFGLMDRPTAGRLEVAGHPVGEGAGKVTEDDLDRIRRENIGFIFQQFYLMATLSALENVEMPQLWTGKADRARAKELLERVGLGHRMTHRPAELSGGEQQRVAVARALINRPKLLLADEPTGNLDTKTRDDIFRLFAELAGEGLAILLATHDVELAGRVSRVIRIDEGRIVG